MSAECKDIFVLESYAKRICAKNLHWNYNIVASPASDCWAMPHTEFFELYIIFKHTNTLQIHIFIQNSNRNTHASYRKNP